MKEKEIYTTPEGNIHKILMFDEINKMVYINIVGTRHEWVHENVYSKWIVNDTVEMPKIYIPDIPAQMTDEQNDSLNKIKEDTIPITQSNEIDVCEQATNGEGMVVENAEPEIIADQKTENKSEEETIKPKRKYTKKQ